MSDEVRFTVLGEPVGKGRPRVTKTGTYTPKKTVSYENLVKMSYSVQAKNHRFADNAMLDMRILAYYPVPKSDSRKTKEAKLRNAIRPTKKPDMDNVMKIVADALNQIAYKDDTQIVDCQIRKFFSDSPRIEVLIRKVGQR